RRAGRSRRSRAASAARSGPGAREPPSVPAGGGPSRVEPVPIPKHPPKVARGPASVKHDLGDFPPVDVLRLAIAFEHQQAVVLARDVLAAFQLDRKTDAQLDDGAPQSLPRD